MKSGAWISTFLQRPLNLSADCSYQTHKWPYSDVMIMSGKSRASGIATRNNTTDADYKETIVQADRTAITMYPQRARQLPWFYGDMFAYCWPLCDEFV